MHPAARWKTQEHLHSLRGERHPVFFGLFFEVNTFTHFSKIIHSLSKMNGWFLNGRCSFTSLSRFSRVFCFFSQGKIPINQTSYHMLPGSRYTHNGIVPLKSVPMGIYWFCCVLWGFLRITTHKYPLIFFFQRGPHVGIGVHPILTTTTVTRLKEAKFALREVWTVTGPEDWRYHGNRRFLWSGIIKGNQWFNKPEKIRPAIS